MYGKDDRTRTFLARVPHVTPPASVDTGAPLSLRIGVAQRGEAQIEKEVKKKRKCVKCTLILLIKISHRAHT